MLLLAYTITILLASPSIFHSILIHPFVYWVYGVCVYVCIHIWYSIYMQPKPSAISSSLLPWIPWVNLKQALLLPRSLHSTFPKSYKYILIHIAKPEHDLVIHSSFFFSSLIPWSSWLPRLKYPLLYIYLGPFDFKLF